MAGLRVHDETVIVELSRIEKIGALHGDIVVPFESIIAVDAVPSAYDAVRGLRAPGTGVPGRLLLGTRRGWRTKDFVAVRGRGPGVVLALRDHDFDRIVTTSDLPVGLPR